MNPIEYFTSAFVGTAAARREHARAIASNPGVLSGVSKLVELSGQDAAPDDEAPIFLLSAGWRSGSTLLQRLIMSDPAVIVWGEPYDECGIIQAIAATTKAFRVGWPPPEYYYGGQKPGTMTGDWIANLFPGAATLRRGFRAFFDATFGEPARQAGFARWGIKEVRLGAEHAGFLRWLYPRAKFVFLYRNPLHAYQSYCRFGRNWYETWPVRPVFTPAAFGRHWRTLMAGYLAHAPALDALLVRYEELVGRDEALLRRVGAHLEIGMDAGVLAKKVGSSEREGEQVRVSRLERALLRRAAMPVARELNYEW